MSGYLSKIFGTGSSVQNIKVRRTHNILIICAVQSGLYLLSLVIRRHSYVLILVNFPKKVSIIIKILSLSRTTRPSQAFSAAMLILLKSIKIELPTISSCADEVRRKCLLY